MLKKEIFGNAIFVKPSEDCVAPVFKGEFFIENTDNCKITICGLGTFRFFINGKKVSDDVFAPATSFYHKYDDCECTVKFGEEMKSRIYAMEYDITDYISAGKNTITATVGSSWYKVYAPYCTLCYKIQCGESVFYSDTSVKWCHSPVTYFNFTCGEKQDYTKSNFDINGIPTDETLWKSAIEAEIPETEYYIQNCPNDKIIRSLNGKKLYENDEYTVFDIGENITGWFVFKCPEKNKKITVAVSEEKDEKGDLHEKWIHYQTAEFICDGTDREYHLLFTWQGFRYVRISKGAELLRVDVIHTDIKNTSSFKCKNRVLNEIYNMYIRTQLCNMHMGIPSDCPHIERRGYTGDGQLVCQDAMLTLDAKNFYLKWMEDISDCQDVHSGHVQYTAPYIPSGGGPGGWGCAIAEVPYTFYKMYSDPEPFKKYYPQMLRYFDYLEAHSENGLITSDQPNVWCLGDWCSPHEKHGMKPEIPEPFVNGYFYVRTIDRMIEMCELIGKGEDKEKLTVLRKEKADVLVKDYYNEKTGDFAENLNSANAFALDLGLGDERTMQNFVEAIRTKPLDTGIFGTEVVVKTLFQNGYFDEATEFLSREEYPSFGYMLNNGATTLWEEWDNPRSMSHPMFGSPVRYMFYYILGIRRAGECGFDDVVIEPKCNKITGAVSGYITTDKGVISVSADPKENICKVKIPNGVTAKIIFDGKIIKE